MAGKRILGWFWSHSAIIIFKIPGSYVETLDDLRLGDRKIGYWDKNVP
jgi:hypothetical protein